MVHQKFEGKVLVYIIVPEYDKMNNIISHAEKCINATKPNEYHVVCIPKIHVGCVNLADSLGYSHILLNQNK
jgi:hypothetical protein